MKKILLLGGSVQQIPAIEYANRHGYSTVLCDCFSDNPGRCCVKQFHCVSTTDKDAVLSVGKEENVDGIVAYASDPAAPTAAYVAEKLGLPTNSFESVETLAYKDKFRKFLSENGFNYPKFKIFDDMNQAKSAIDTLALPVIVKPVDSSASKGVSKIDAVNMAEDAINRAFENSRNRRIIIEEFVVKDHDYMVGGDCFVLDGHVVYWGLLNCHRDFRVNSLVPAGKSYPLMLNDKRKNLIKDQIQKVVDLLAIKFGGFNLEIMFDCQDKLYLIEMGPRNGGNMIPDLLNVINGVDLVEATIEAAMGNQYLQLESKENNAYYATQNLHTVQNGIFAGMKYKKGIEKNIIKRVIFKSTGDLVEYFDQANKAIGIVFFKFDTLSEMLEVTNNLEAYIEVIVE